MARLFILLVCLLSISTSSFAGLEKIVLWDSEKSKDPQNKQINFGESWYWLFYETISVGDDGNIYVFNRSGGNIVVFNPSGNIVKTIPLSKKITGKRGFSFEVLDGGTRFYFGSADSFLVDENGEPIKRIKDSYGGLYKHCDNVLTNIYGDDLSEGQYQQLEIIKGRKSKYHNSKDEVFRYFEDSLKKVFDKRAIPEHLRNARGSLIGIDCRDNVYYKVSGVGKAYVVSFNSSWAFRGAVELPPFPINLEEGEEWEPTDWLFSYAKMNCNGDIYNIYMPSLLPDGAGDRWKDLGEYFVYKISFDDNPLDLSEFTGVFSNKEYVGATRLYDNNDLIFCGNKDDQQKYIRLLRNEIFARHGRIFQSEDLNSVFKQTDWYKENPDYSDDLLNEVENQNVKFIYDFEKSQGWR